MATTTLCRVDAGHTADTVEWNVDDPRLVAVGTYQLDADSGRREGRLLLFRTADAESSLPPQQVCATEARAGVLDCTWVAGDRLVSADADGFVSVHTASAAALQPACRLRLLDSGLVLSVHASADSLVASDSQGHLSLLSLTPSGPALARRWAAHEFEAWFAALSPSLIASGGDDCRLRLWDVRSAAPVAGARLDMGVTCAAWRPDDANSLAVGCYDEQVRLWDVRAMRRPVAAVAVGGGVWRVRWGGGRLLCAAMHAGFVVVSGEAVAARYEEHGSLAYGADWREATGGEAEFLCGTCSFYDRAVHFWTLRL